MESTIQAKASEKTYRLAPFLSPLGVWAYGVGTAIGWGSFVVTSNQYLLQAGPLGSLLGIAGGTIVMVAIALTGLLCTQDKRLKERIVVVLAIVFTAGISLCFGATLFKHGSSGMSMRPALLPGTGFMKQILSVSIMTPWAFIGFEGISHSAEEFAFPRKKISRITVAVVVTTAALYGMVILMSVTAYPSQYDSWLAYLMDLGNLSGIEALPPFYAAYRALGNAGVNILIYALLALIVTSLIGNIVALSRLFVTLGHDGILPEAYAQLNTKGTPEKAVLAVAAVSMVIPFLGRTAIGWIVDITTIGAVITYGLVSFSARRAAHTDNDKLHQTTGTTGTAAMVFLGIIIALPNLISLGSMAQETYFLLTAWSLLGFVYLRIIMVHDESETYGQSVAVWIVMLSFVLFSSMVWLQKSNLTNAQNVIDEISGHVSGMATGQDGGLEVVVQESLQRLERANLRSTLISVAMFVAAIGLMMSNYAYVRKRNEQNRLELGAVKAAYGTDPLTGVKSKHAFVESEQTLNERITSNEVDAFGIVVCDVNGLKFINDTLGHKAGDEYIKAASRIVCTHFAHSPVYRIGGDEFVAILEGSDYERRAELCAAFDREVEANIGTTNAVISAGLSIFDPALDVTFHEVFERADALMYQRKLQLKSMGAATRDSYAPVQEQTGTQS